MGIIYDYTLKKCIPWFFAINSAFQAKKHNSFLYSICSSHPKALVAVVVSYNRDELGLMDRTEWHKNSSIVRYGLCAFTTWELDLVLQQPKRDRNNGG